MKIIVILFFVIFSQSLMAKISDFNTLINEHSKMQNEIYNSINAKNTEPIESSGGAEQTEKVEIIVLDNYHELSSLTSSPKKTGKKTLNKKKLSQSDDIEEKHFLRLGAELNDAH